MAKNLNNVNLRGRLTADPELRVAGNARVVNFTVANNRDNGEKVRANFIRCVAFNNVADALQKFGYKGQDLLITGELSQRTYTAKEGKQAEIVEVIVTSLEFLSWKDDNKTSQPKQNVRSYQNYTDNKSDDLPFY